MKTKNSQLELTLNHHLHCPSTVRRQRRLTRAAFWFNRMRQVVDSAIDHAPTPSSGNDQFWIVRS